jgi:hypothetical protein
VPGGRCGVSSNGGQRVHRPTFGGGSGSGYNPAGVAGSAGLLGEGAANFLGGLNGLMQGSQTAPTRCSMLVDKANQAAATTGEAAKRLKAWEIAHATGIGFACDQAGLDLMRETLTIEKNQKAAFQAAFVGCPNTYVSRPSNVSYEHAFATINREIGDCRKYLAGNRDRNVYGSGTAQNATAYGSASNWKRKCELLEKRKQNEAVSCWGGLAESTAARGDQTLIDYANNRASELAQRGPQGEDAQETQRIAPGCSADFPIRRTGPVCRGVPGAIQVGTRIACCVATRSLRERLRERLQKSLNE